MWAWSFLSFLRYLLLKNCLLGHAAVVEPPLYEDEGGGGEGEPLPELETGEAGGGEEEAAGAGGGAEVGFGGVGGID